MQRRHPRSFHYSSTVVSPPQNYHHHLLASKRARGSFRRDTSLKRQGMRYQSTGKGGSLHSPLAQSSFVQFNWHGLSCTRNCRSPTHLNICYPQLLHQCPSNWACKKPIWLGETVLYEKNSGVINKPFFLLQTFSLRWNHSLSDWYFTYIVWSGVTFPLSQKLACDLTCR